MRAFCGLVIGFMAALWLVVAYLYLSDADYKDRGGGAGSVPPIPASSKMPDPVVVPAVAYDPAGQARSVPKARGVPGVGINPFPGVYPAGWGPCGEGQNTFGPGGAFGWGCPTTAAAKP